MRAEPFSNLPVHAIDSVRNNRGSELAFLASLSPPMIREDVLTVQMYAESLGFNCCVE